MIIEFQMVYRKSGLYAKQLSSAVIKTSKNYILADIIEFNTKDSL